MKFPPQPPPPTPAQLAEYAERRRKELRDAFAIAALQGYGQNMIVMSNAIEGWKETGRGGTRETCIAEYIAGLAYEVADAMLKAREE